MATVYPTNKERRHIADTYYQLRKFKSKVQRKAADIGFVRKALALEVTPTFAKVKGQFKSRKDKWKAEKMILESNLRQHYKEMKDLRKKLKEEEKTIKEVHSTRFYKFIETKLNATLREERLKSFKTKNKKLERLIAQMRPKRESVQSTDNQLK